LRARIGARSAQPGGQAALHDAGVYDFAVKTAQ
jgi:hypothetical protein